MNNVGLFAGIGGLEEGLRRAGFETQLVCEKDLAASFVLRHRFPEAAHARDVRDLRKLPRTDVLAAGFPCQDLSQAGRARGLDGTNSGLVKEVFRLVASQRSKPRWLLFENVPFMLWLEGGRTLKFICDSLTELGYTWAYRIIDTRAFGLPQRRRRVIVCASRKEDPRAALLARDARSPHECVETAEAFGFYWTEGNRGLGWAIDAIPALKTGSGVSIPSPPAIWFRRTGTVGLPHISDAERLQGFRPGWTNPRGSGDRPTLRRRWGLIGNAVSVPVAAWVGRQLVDPAEYDASGDTRHSVEKPWPGAAWGHRGKIYRAHVSEFPVAWQYTGIADFLLYETTPLSYRASSGFLGRARKSRLRFADGFLDSLQSHVDRMEAEEALNRT